MQIPTLETPRLILRPLTPDDFEPLCAFYATEHSKFVGGPMTPELVWRALATELGHWALRGFGRWAVEEKATGKMVGLVGLWRPEGFPENELGWDLLPEATGQGYATEAALAARAYAYETLAWPTLVSMIVPENTGSIGVATRLGAEYDSDFTHERFGPMQLWRHPAPEAVV